MNLSPDWVQALQSYNIEALHWSAIGLGSAPDPEIMQYAREHRYVILTNDLDFGNHLASSRAAFPSVVQLRMDELDPTVVGSWVIEMLQQMDAELKQGALMTIHHNRTRTRLLPFPSSDR